MLLLGMGWPWVVVVDSIVEIVYQIVQTQPIGDP